MNAADRLQEEISDRAFLCDHFGGAISTERLDAMPHGKIHQLRIDVEHFGLCHDIFGGDNATPSKRAMLQNMLIRLIKKHPECEDLVEIVVWRSDA